MKTAAIKPSSLQRRAMAPELRLKMNAYWHAANYLSVGQICLSDNPLLKERMIANTVSRVLRYDEFTIS
jgi:phosphoketolase